MPALTPQYMMDLESRMQVITEREYDRLLSRLWWRDIAKPRTTGARRDVILWLLSTAMIRSQDKGGNIAFEDIVSQYTELEVEASGAGLKLFKHQLEDTDGNGVELSSQWSSDIGAYMSYWPQKQVTRFLKTAHLPGTFVSYDRLPFFDKLHPVNPFKTYAGTYANLMTGAPAPASGATPYYPGALPIDDSVTIDVALQNLTKLVSYVASIRMANGEDPRQLRLRGLLVPPRLMPRAVQLTQAKFIAQAIGGAGVGTTDVEALIGALGFATPIQADELAGFEDDTTYFAIAEQLSTSQLGAVLYTEREPFKIDYYGVTDESILGRAREFEWQCHGRNGLSAGHPYLLIKCPKL